MPSKILTDDTFAAEMGKLNQTLLRLASNNGGLEINSMEDLNAIVRLGRAKEFLEVGDQVEVERETNITVSKGNSQGITAVSITASTFLAKMGTTHAGVYEATFDGNVWHKENGEVITLSEYGITVTGTPQENDVVIVTETANTLAFDVVDFDKMTPRNPKLTKSIQLLMHDVLLYGTMPFSVPQLLYYALNGLAAGNYKFTLDHAAYGGGTQYDGTYMFTLTQAIPAKGGFRHTNIGSYKSSYSQSDVIGNYLKTYQPVSSDGTGGAEIETVAVSLYDDATECSDLGTFTAQNRSYMTDDGYHNSTERNAYGSNRYKDSVYRQWLNSNASSNFWKPQSVFDRIPGGSTMAGFLYGLDQEFVDALGEVQVKTALHQFDRVNGATYDITYDKVYLVSRKDVYGTDEYNDISEGSQLEYYKNTTNADKIKYQSGSARYWWLRTPYSSHACNVRFVYSSGGVGDRNAGDAGGVVPACSICGKVNITVGD